MTKDLNIALSIAHALKFLRAEAETAGLESLATEITEVNRSAQQFIAKLLECEFAALEAARGLSQLEA